MITTCPNCHTEFNIPDSAYRPGRKARCAICQHIFVLPAVAPVIPDLGSAAAMAGQPEQTPDTEAKLFHTPAAPDEPAAPDGPGQPIARNEQSAPPPAYGQPMQEAVQPASDDPAEGSAQPEKTPAEESAGSAFDEFLRAGMSEEQAPDSALREPKIFSDSELDAVLQETASRQTVTDSVSPDEGEHNAQKASGKGKRVFLALATLICLGGMVLGGYRVFLSFNSSSAGSEPAKQIVNIEPAALDKVRNLDITTSGVKYDYIRNQKLGPILVLEGRVTNKFSTPKDNITVEARLLNSKGVVIKSQRQICGVTLTPLQLTALGQNELANALNNRIEIMANNVNVMPGTDVPYMVVFIYPPDNAVEYEVSVVDAADPPEQ